MRKAVTKRKPTSAKKQKPTAKKRKPPTPTPTPSPGPRPKGPIQHVVIIIKENHAFDNYFGRFPGADDDPNLPLASDPPPSDHRRQLPPAAGCRQTPRRTLVLRTHRPQRAPGRTGQGRPEMVGGPARRDRQGWIVAQHRHLHHGGRLRRLVRPRHSAAAREVDRRHPIPPRVARRVPCAEPIRKGRVHLTRSALPCQPGEVLRDDVRPAADQRTRPGLRRSVRL